MAIRQGNRERRIDGAVVYTWTAIDATDTGSPALVTDDGFIDVQVIGALGTSVLAIEGSMDGTNWAGLTMSPTPVVAATISRASQRALFIRPNLGAGTGAALTVIAVVQPGKV